ncbi:hypothetical protein RRG08_042348 [Elysia crispata]|uniref:Uncharacterized protein n=1 Tax=Elysia crispata TaxID=231223 RepID=A0AAE0ZBX9_9GAST|nr:hypothetical protein RRG08_042348 [Elysia crispata]
MSLETESPLDYVKIMQNRDTFKDNDVLVDIQYTDGCETKFKLTNRNTTTFDRPCQQRYLLKTPASHTHYDTTKTGFGFRTCNMPFPTNIDWYKEKLTQRPTARLRYTCMTGAENSAMTTTSTTFACRAPRHCRGHKVNLPGGRPAKESSSHSLTGLATVGLASRYQSVSRTIKIIHVVPSPALSEHLGSPWTLDAGILFGASMRIVGVISGQTQGSAKKQLVGVLEALLLAGKTIP